MIDKGELRTRTCATDLQHAPEKKEIRGMIRSCHMSGIWLKNWKLKLLDT
jgi:hypothetical protein